MINFCLIRPNNLLPVINGPILIAGCEFHACLTMTLESNGFLTLGAACKPFFFNVLRIVSGLTLMLVVFARLIDAWTAVSHFPEVISRITFRLSVSDNNCGRPGLRPMRSGRCFLLIWLTV